MLCFLPFTVLHCFSWPFSSSHRVVWTILVTVKKFQLISIRSGFDLISYVLCSRDWKLPAPPSMHCSSTRLVRTLLYLSLQMQRVTEVSHWQLWMWVRMDYLQVIQLSKVHESAFPELLLQDVGTLDLAKSNAQTMPGG